ncbi:MAG: hypothetical protein IJS05_02910 [Paludibacteraceae bacterium]|nr:hypothetical protein [Paludibacteraceae bacterium]
MNTLLIIAEESEREMATRLFPAASVLVTGVGAINIYRSLNDIPRDTQLINVGYAGSANFEIGTWVRVTESFLHHPNVKYPEPEQHLPTNIIQPATDIKFIEAPCYSAVDFVVQSPYNDCVFDMELAFICAMGFKNVHSYKYVSDNLSLHEYRDTANPVELTVS